MFKVYPNPATDWIYLAPEMMPAGDAVVEIYNVNGTKVLIRNVDADELFAPLSITNLVPGIYFIIVKSGGYTYRSRLVVM